MRRRDIIISVVMELEGKIVNCMLEKSLDIHAVHCMPTFADVTTKVKY